MANKPEKVVKAGSVRAVIWRNVPKGASGPRSSIAKVVLEVRYRDAAGRWRGTPSLSIPDLPKAILALQEAYAYLMASAEGRTPHWSLERRDS
jgi:hypothetical protein